VKKVGSYLKSNDKCLKEGDALLEKGDYVQALEKFGERPLKDLIELPQL